MKYLMLTAVAAIAALTVTACAQKKGGTAAPVPSYAVTGPAQCNAGQIYNATYGCLDRGLCTGDQGWVPTTQKCEPGTPVSFDQVYGSTAGARWGYPLKNLTRGVFENLMRDYGGFCGRYNWIFYLGTNPDDCKNYSDEGYIIIQAVSQGSNEISVTIGAGASTPYSKYDYWSAYYGGNSSFPMQFRATVYPINNGQGFEFRANGLSGTNSWNAINTDSIRGYAPNGRLTDNRIQIELSYKSAKFADAPVERY